MNEEDENSILAEIQTEYNKIDKRWLNLHFHTFVGLMVFGVLIECILGAVLYFSSYIEIALPKYILKYIIAPFLINAGFVLAGIGTIHAPRLQQKVKVYLVSLLMVGVCFVFFTVHNIFSSLYLIFTGPILLTVVYSDYVLTTVTASVSIAAKIASELFIRWDPDKVSPFANEDLLINFVISIFILCAFYVVCVVVIRFEREKNTAGIQKERERYQMQQKLITDDLTKVYNRTALRDAFRQMENDAPDSTYIFVMIDLDDFKRLNDTLGHDTGDQCLKILGKSLLAHCSGNAKPFRFGGDEFCILFQNCELKKVTEVCEAIQGDLRKSNIAGLNVPLTVSIGIAGYQQPMDAKRLLQVTDLALYRAKKSKDAIRVYDGTDTSC